MASEFVLGMHGQLEFDGRRLAGMWPRDLVKVAAEAGVTMFGPAVNVNTTKSVAWNVARALTIVKPCVAEATIPVHMNVGMGVGGVPHDPVPARRRGRPRVARHAHMSGGSTACRWVSATRSAWPAAMRSPRAWAECEPPEIWWPACR